MSGRPARAPQTRQQRNTKSVPLTRNWAEGSSSSSGHVTWQQRQLAHVKSASSPGAASAYSGYADMGQERAWNLFKDNSVFHLREKKIGLSFIARGKALHCSENEQDPTQLSSLERIWPLHS